MPGFVRNAIIFGAPLLLALLNAFHPVHRGPSGAYQALAPHLPWWLILHLCNLVAFALLGLAAFLLLRAATGRAATLGRIAIAAYVPFYLGLDTLAGIATGVLIQYGQTLPADQVAPVEGAVEVLWSGRVTHAFGALGSIAWAVAVFSAAVAFAEKRTKPIAVVLGVLALILLGWGVRTTSVATWPWWTATALIGALAAVFVRPHGPGALLILSGILFGTAHVRPYGPLGMLCFLGAAILLARSSPGLRPAPVS